jgi:hypothetical protein
VTGLLPDAVRHAVDARSRIAAADSFGVVAVVLLLVLLVETEVLRVVRARSERQVALLALVAPLLVAAGLTMIVRVVVLIP